MKDTYIDNTGKQIIEDNKDMFEGFNTKWIQFKQLKTLKIY